MNIYKSILIILTVLATGTGFSQSGQIKMASKDYDNFNYVKTAEILLKVAEKGYKSEDMFQKLGDAYYFNNQMNEAVKWYSELMNMNQNQSNPEYYFRYALALKTSGNYEESDVWMSKFAEIKTEDSRSKYFSSKTDYLEHIANSEQDLELLNLDINSDKSDFGSTIYKDQLIYASAQGKGKLYKWNGQPFLDLYVAAKDSSGNYTGNTVFNKAINSRFHESSVTFSPDGQTMYFTRNNYTNRKKKSDEEGTTKLKLYKRTLDDEGQWTNEEALHFNSDQYSVAHPTINATGTKLYFASDMPGTHGMSDLYVVDIDLDGSLGVPQNLGRLINAEGQETFPFINTNGDLYFSSNSYPGLGGLDVFVIRNFEELYNTGNFDYSIENLSLPINSAYDDFAYYEDLKSHEGFISSNRPGGKGDDDIYSFYAEKPMPCKQELNGVVLDSKTGQLLPNSMVILFDEYGYELQRLIVGDDAKFTFAVECNKNYLVRAEKLEYSSAEERISTPKTDLKLNSKLGVSLCLELLLEPEAIPFSVDDDIRDILGINIIYFDFDKDYIRSPDATAELQKIIEFMKTYPTVKIDVRSHTDSRASHAYNEDLSARRNKSTIDYIVAGGIDRSRLTGRGYGERNLVNKCADGVKCSEAMHDLNRRSEFVVIDK